MKVIPDGNIEQFTVAQIHSKEYLNFERGVPLRVVYIAEREGKNDHLWVNQRLDLVPGQKDNQYFDMGPMPTEFFNLELTVDNQMLTVRINGTATFQYNWTFLAPLPQNYFKAGTYLNSNDTGTATVLFKGLRMGPS